jgi:hypothetical protein
MEHRYAFVLRIWLTEPSTANGRKIGGLRGTLQAVNSSEPSHFSSLRQLSDLLEMALQQNEPPASASD